MISVSVRESRSNGAESPIEYLDQGSVTVFIDHAAHVPQVDVPVQRRMTNREEWTELVE